MLRKPHDLEDSPARNARADDGNNRGGGPSSTFAVTTPSISLPKGGGAIRGTGEKFAANPVTGTGSLTVPIFTSPGRSGFGPQLSLSYDSGAGNGPFGFGWSLSLPQITRKTDKGLPRYNDGGESDAFMLSGAEDLVPIFKKDANGDWVRDAKGNLAIDDDDREGFTIRTYRPRIEGLFARIERWTRQGDGDVHWRSISKDNVLTLYGKDADSRIAGPADPRRIFSWLICETRDDKGNAVIYKYKTEDGTGVDLTQAHEGNRGDLQDSMRTANRHLKRICYGNRAPMLDETGHRPRLLSQAELDNAGWMFEVVFDYGEHDAADPKPDDAGDWICRLDPFSTYRSGFDVRTYRLCRRVLMFHHFPAEAGVGQDCLVRSTEFDFEESPIAAFMAAVTGAGYKRVEAGGYARRSLPPLEFEYSKAIIGHEIHDVDPESIENLSYGVDGTAYQWVDLDGEGLSGVLTEQGGAWFYKRNESAATRDATTDTYAARFAPVERVANIPAGAPLGGGRWQFLDLAGDGQVDLVALERPVRGFYERTAYRDWEPFRAFRSLPNLEWSDPNLKFIDLNGDGHADVLITEDEAFTWYPSMAEEGFGTATRVGVPSDEEQGPRVVFADGTQTIFQADLSGDGLTDIARIRNGEVCYWPNLGYGRFGGKVTMDASPEFDTPDQFDPRRIRLADIDGSGITDIIYLGRDRTRFWFNQSGNAWSQANDLPGFPPVDNIASVAAVDLLGNGTACLVWSSPLPGETRAPMKYIKLMAEGKPHLLVSARNNLGAETRVRYAPSTYFYLQDKYDGKPWVTKLPFPVHVVERVETYDHVSRNRFVTRYAYHHGYFDGVEREFRGFGMVEQWDTEAFAALSAGDAFPVGDNTDAASHVPPVHTKTWFHTGVYVGRDHVSDFFAGLIDEHDRGEYYREPGLSDPEARELLLADTELPDELTPEEEREACRALKGAMLRQEVYGLDGTPKAEHPYIVTEQSFTVRRLQPRGGNRHAVFFTHAREALNYHYERNPADPRTSHALTLEVDAYGNVLKEAAVGYGRRQSDADLAAPDRNKQTRTLITYTENRVTHPIDDPAWHPDDFRTPLTCETRTFELTGYTPTGAAGRFQSSDLVRPEAGGLTHIFQSEIPYEDSPTAGLQRRLIEHERTLYRPDDLGAAQNDPLRLLPLGTVQPLALTGESYKLAFTPGLLDQVFERDGQPLLPDPAGVLGGAGPDRGGYVQSQRLKTAGAFPDTDPDDHWWIPGDRVFLSPQTGDTAAQELAYAHQHFFLPHRYRDPFHTRATSTETIISFDSYDLLMLESRDPLGNRVTVGERLPNGDLDPAKPGNDYRVLQAWRTMDPNRNRTQVAFDTLGMVVGTAVMGKPGQNLGDSLDGFAADLTEAEILDHLSNPPADPHAILGRATTRLVYDLFAYDRTKDQPDSQPGAVYTLTRVTHDADLEPGQQTGVQHSFSYSDGFGREIQKKIQAEPGPLMPGESVVSPRWVGSGWTIFNNKGKPVRQYEPFFSATHGFELGVLVGVSSILFYDPVERVVATLLPNHTYEKVVFDPWRRVNYDANDTVMAEGLQTGDPRTDPDIRGCVTAYFDTQPLHWETWHSQRQGGAQEQAAADKAAHHADTPTKEYFDTLGRPFLTLAHNRFQRDGATVNETYATRVELDIEGNQRALRDAIEQSGDAQGRIVMRYIYDLLGNRIHQLSMEAGARRMLDDVSGKPIRSWDSRGHAFRTEYDPLRRPLRSFVTGADPVNPNQELLTERLVYGEQHPETELRNLSGELYLHLDQAGAAGTEAHDFKGNPLRVWRWIAREYEQAIQWSAVDAVLPAHVTAKLNLVALEAALAPRMEADTFTSRTTYDALDRPVTLTAPHTPGMQPSVVRPGYNEANLLERVDANLRGATADGQPVWTPLVTNIDYDAKGQRERIDYGNGVSSFYEYDPLTFRLVHLLTRRNAVVFPDDCPQTPPAGWPGCRVQNLRYTYDPVGNITHIRNDAQQTIYFRNKRVEPGADYTYDALYRLIEATGREHLGQVGGTPIPHSHNDAPRVGIDWSANDGNAMGTYTERYVYDAVGNLLEMQHRGTDPAHPAWKRTYAYHETSLIEGGTGDTPFKTSNRLSSTTVGSNNPELEPYVYDAHGNMTRMPHMGGAHPDPNMQWDYVDQLRQTDLGGGGTAYYVYDAAGQRVRKVWEKAANLVEERIYLGDFEIFRRRDGAGAVTLERETLHIMDDQQRIALVESRTHGDDGSPAHLVRYQIENQLRSACLELDDQGQLVSYEEYYPYGGTSFQSVDKNIGAAAKRYGYTGKERDDESGLHYHGARYYASWLGRWSSPDPAGLVDGPNLYSYVRHSPSNLRDPTGLAGVSDCADDIILQIGPHDPRLGGQSGSTPQPTQVAQAQPQPPGQHPQQQQRQQQRANPVQTFQQQAVRWIDARIAYRERRIEQARRYFKSKNKAFTAQSAMAHRTMITRLRGLRVDIVRALTAGNRHGADLLTVANVVRNEAGEYPHAKLAIAYGFLNKVGGVVRRPTSDEVSGYEPLPLLWNAFTHTERLSFLESFVGSVDAARQRLDDANPPLNDPTRGATHWVSPRGLPEYDPSDRDHRRKRYRRTYGKWKNRGFPKWARDPNTPEVLRMQGAGQLGQNYNEFAIRGVPGEEFLFYTGVR